jgi:hypothetical protein
MLRAAEALGRDIDFVRADFYDTDARLYFGELTTTPGGGLEPLRPVSLDYQLGTLWHLPPRRADGALTASLAASPGPPGRPVPPAAPAESG